MIAGSARVSADGQTLAAQQAALREAGAIWPSGILAPTPCVLKAIPRAFRRWPVPVRAHFFNF
jgi:hypothetical protein